TNSDRVMKNGQPADYQWQSWGWAYQILPYLEQQTLWAAPEDVAAETPIPTYVCPSFRGPIVRPYAQGNNPGNTSRRAMMDYTANCGQSQGSYDGPVVPSKNGYSGITGLVRKLSDITDGTSNTLLVGEKFVVAIGAYDPNWYRPGGSTYGPCN